MLEPALQVMLAGIGILVTTCIAIDWIYVNPDAAPNSTAESTPADTAVEAAPVTEPAPSATIIPLRQPDPLAVAA
ncbi:MAG: hypothetical protein DI585_00890 [Pseudomonas fluorescens]|nr:MAG: hypothetical protein DI585_00890 [Pseudomonas fluorescens]